MPKWARILATIGVAVVLVGVYLSAFGVQTGCALMARYKFRSIPEAAKTPVALPDASVSVAPHKKVSYFGYEFELPWDDVDEQNVKAFGTVHVTYFHSGNIVWFSTFPPKNFVNEISKSTQTDPVLMRQMYGDNAFQSDYAFTSRMLQITPSKISPFSSRKEAVSGMMLLILKTIAMPNADSGLFSIHTGDFKGFQYCSPQSQSTRIVDDLFADDGGVEFWFGLNKKGAVPDISQAQINRVLQSVRKVSISAPAASR
ncbi:MAG: hypothetical protein LAN36_01300 [Acidobacteriia bacterium]|nr:hypothetical protein [Terriglobia bacterium]